MNMTFHLPIPYDLVQLSSDQIFIHGWQSHERIHRKMMDELSGCIQSWPPDNQMYHPNHERLHKSQSTRPEWRYCSFVPWKSSIPRPTIDKELEELKIINQNGT
jgi:hypothetical protein